MSGSGESRGSASSTSFGYLKASAKTLECEQRLVELKSRMLDLNRTEKPELRDELFDKLLHQLGSLDNLWSMKRAFFARFLDEVAVLRYIYNLKEEDFQVEMDDKWIEALYRANDAVDELNIELSKSFIGGSIEKTSHKFKRQKKMNAREGLHQVHQLQEKLLKLTLKVYSQLLAKGSGGLMLSGAALETLEEAVHVIWSLSTQPFAKSRIVPASDRVLRSQTDRLRMILHGGIGRFQIFNSVEAEAILKQARELEQCIDEFQAVLPSGKTDIMPSETEATLTPEKTDIVSREDKTTQTEQWTIARFLKGYSSGSSTTQSLSSSYSQHMPTEAKLSIKEWGDEFLKMLRGWLWNNGRATTFYSKCLCHQSHQDNLVDIMMWILCDQICSSSTKKITERLLRKVLELALTPVPDSLSRRLSEFVESEEFFLTEMPEVAGVLAMCPPINAGLRDFLMMIAGQGQDGGKLSAMDKPSAKEPTTDVIKTEKAPSEEKRKELEQSEGGSKVSDDEDFTDDKEVNTIQDALVSFLDSKEIPHYQIIHDPPNDRHVQVVGVRVNDFQKDLSSLAGKENYTLSVKNKEVELDSRGFPLLSNWIVSCAGIIPDPIFALHSNDSHVVSINAIMQADIKRHKRSSEEYFALTTAHAILSEEQRKKLNGCTREFDNLFDELEREFPSKGYTMAVKRRNAQDSQEIEDIDVISPPQWIYKYFVRRDDTSKWAALQDIAFLNLVDKQVDTAGLISSGNQSVDPDEQSLVGFQDAYIKKICSQKALGALVGQKVLCQGKEGVVVESSATKVEDRQKAGHVMGIHLEFRFDDPKFKLKEGDCGSLVYLAKKEDGKLPIVGMFFGQLLEDEGVHCAVILHWNIKLAEAEETSKLKLKNIKLATHSPDAEFLPPGETESELNDERRSASSGIQDDA